MRTATSRWPFFFTPYLTMHARDIKAVYKALRCDSAPHSSTWAAARLAVGGFREPLPLA